MSKTTASSEEVDLLLRKIDNQIKQRGQGKTEVQVKANYLELVRRSPVKDQAMFYTGHVCAFICGGAIPTLQIYFAETFDAFQAPDKEEQAQKMLEIFIMMVCIGGAIWLLGYIYWVLLANFAANLTFRMKKEYLKAILQQECAWFDQTNFTELSSKLARETAAINRGYGEKAGNVSLAFGTFLSGLAVGFWMGWELALALMILVPFISLIAWMFGKIQSESASNALKFYSQSAGYAEQCLMAIRVVVAFGNEQVEARNYTKHLTDARDKSVA
jgi:ABC-type multidrug transport system fused ATPase/permease subunit